MLLVTRRAYSLRCYRVIRGHWGTSLNFFEKWQIWRPVSWICCSQSLLIRLSWCFQESSPYVSWGEWSYFQLQLKPGLRAQLQTMSVYDANRGVNFNLTCFSSLGIPESSGTNPRQENMSENLNLITKTSQKHSKLRKWCEALFIDFELRLELGREFSASTLIRRFSMQLPPYFRSFFIKYASIWKIGQSTIRYYYKH